MRSLDSQWHPGLSGAVAGAVSAFAFTIIHHIFISDIWFSLLLMMVAGAICGMCIGWSFSLLVNNPTSGKWLQYNALYVIVLLFLGATSLLIFNPITTIAALIELNGPPDQLIREALPFTAVFTLAAAIVISLLYGRSWSRFGAVLLTCVILVTLLGLNVSILGLVAIPGSAYYLIMELFGLILALNVVYVATFAGLERKHLFHHDHAKQLLDDTI